MEYFRNFVAWSDYVGTQLVLAEIAEDNAHSELEIAKAKATVPENKKAVSLIKAEVAKDEDVIEADNAYRTARYYRKLLSTISGTLERRSALMSRELTRRLDTDKHINRSWK